MSEHEEWMERLVRAERVNQFAHSIATQMDLPTVIQEAISRTRDLCEADGASLLLVDPLTDELYFDAVVGDASNQIQQIRLRPGQGIAGTVAQTGHSMLVKDAKKNTFFSGDCDAKSGFQTGSLIAVALCRGTKVLGVLEAVRSSGQPSFDELHLKRLEGLAPHVTIAVHNAQITAQLLESQTRVRADNATLERKVTERTLLLSRAKLEWERTFDAMEEPIALQDGFTLRRVNRAYAQRVGRPFQEILGKTCHSLFAHRDTPCMGCPLISQRAEGEIAEISTQDGITYTLSTFALASEKEALPPATVVQYRNVTRQRHMEQRLRETERLASIGQLASGAAHEINNPLGFVISNLSGLKSNLEEIAQPRADLLEEIREMHEMIDESLEGAQRVKEIVRGLRELSRLEVGRAEPACVNASVTRASRAELGNDSMSLTYDLQASEKVFIPPLQLDHVLSHILRNARQAISGQQKICVSTRDVGEQVEVEIADEGCGITAENLHRIFEPFFTTRGIGKGIGLGLTAAYGIVTRYGGTLEAQSTVGAGSRFVVRLPIIQGQGTRQTLPKTVGSPTKTAIALDVRAIL